MPATTPFIGILRGLKFLTPGITYVDQDGSEADSFLPPQQDKAENDEKGKGEEANASHKERRCRKESGGACRSHVRCRKQGSQGEQ